MLLVAGEDVMEGDCAFEGASHGSVGDWEEGPALEMGESAGEWEVGEQDGRPLRTQAFSEGQR
jgi:hypothetical protein